MAIAINGGFSVSHTILLHSKQESTNCSDHLKYPQLTRLIASITIAAASNCQSVCKPLSDVLYTPFSSKGSQPQYWYCTSNADEYTSYAQACVNCLQGQPGGVILGNFMDTMNRACENQPQASAGALISTVRDLFDSSTIVPTSTTASNLTVVSTSTTVATTPSPDSSKGDLTTATTAGIGVGSAFAGIFLLTLVVMLVLRKRRQKDNHVRQDTEPCEANGIVALEKDAQGRDVQEKEALQVYEAEVFTPPQELDADNIYPRADLAQMCSNAM